jgi:hypothetical protein
LSDPASSICPSLGCTLGSLTHTTQTVNTPAGGPYVTTNNFARNGDDMGDRAQRVKGKV